MEVGEVEHAGSLVSAERRPSKTDRWESIPRPEGFVDNSTDVRAALPPYNHDL